MPGKNGTGPIDGGGPGSGRGQGRGQGMGRNQGSRAGSGPDGQCVCSSCGTEAPHKRGIPCYEEKCPKCGASMVKK